VKGGELTEEAGRRGLASAFFASFSLWFNKIGASQGDPGHSSVRLALLRLCRAKSWGFARSGAFGLVPRLRLRPNGALPILRNQPAEYPSGPV